MRNNIIVISGIIIILFGIFKGYQIWKSSLNKKLLQGHVSFLLEKSGVRDVRIHCKMVRDTKVGYCQLRLSPQEILKLQKILKLKYHNWESINRQYAEEMQKWNAEGGCRDVINMANRHKYNFYKSRPKAQELKLPNGLHFTYMLIYRHSSRGDSCMQASYAD